MFVIFFMCFLFVHSVLSAGECWLSDCVWCERRGYLSYPYFQYVQPALIQTRSDLFKPFPVIDCMMPLFFIRHILLLHFGRIVSLHIMNYMPYARIWSMNEWNVSRFPFYTHSGNTTDAIMWSYGFPWMNWHRITHGMAFLRQFDYEKA